MRLQRPTSSRLSRVTSARCSGVVSIQPQTIIMTFPLGINVRTQAVHKEFKQRCSQDWQQLGMLALCRGADSVW